MEAIEERRIPQKLQYVREKATHSEWREKKNGWQNKRYSRRKDQGLCSDCPMPAIRGKGKCKEHLKKAADIQNKIMAERIGNGVCTRCGNGPLVTKRHCKKCREIINGWTINKRKKEVELIKDHYGRECVCCGEKEPVFLTLDHKNDDGGEQRKKKGHSDMYFIIARNFRKTGVWTDDLQVLCYNCNSGRYRNGGVCPHQQKREGG